MNTMNSNFQSFPEFPDFQGEPKRGRGFPFAVASLVLGIVAVCICCVYCGATYIFTAILGVLAIVFSIVSRSMDKKFHGLAIAGLILGIFALVLFFCMLGLVIWFNSITLEEWDALLMEFFQDEELVEYYKEIYGTEYDMLE